MTVVSIRYPVPDATLETLPDGSVKLTCPLCGKPGDPLVLHFKPGDGAELAERYLDAHSIRLGEQP